MTIYAVPSAIASHAHIDKDTYDKLYQQSIEQPDIFWTERANEFFNLAAAVEFSWSI